MKTFYGDDEDVDIGGYRRFEGVSCLKSCVVCFSFASQVAYSRTTGHTTVSLLLGWISYHCLPVMDGWMDGRME
jgi:hypothetical protein